MLTEAEEPSKGACVPQEFPEGKGRESRELPTVHHSSPTTATGSDPLFPYSEPKSFGDKPTD